MTQKQMLVRIALSCMVCVTLSNCSTSTPPPTVTPGPPLFLGDGGTTSSYPSPNTVSEAIVILSNQSSNYTQRLAAIEIIAKSGPKADEAVPTVIENLDNTDNWVREQSAWALGEIGSTAQPAVQKLCDMLKGNGTVRERRNAAEALQKIGDRSAIPVLAQALNDEAIAINAARALGFLAKQEFTDLHSTSYKIENGVPLIVQDAKRWWEEEGKLLDWSNL